jgi:TonB family protein
MTSHRVLAEWSQWFWPAFANHLWQTTLIACFVWGAAKIFNRAPARFRYFFWLAALMKFLIPSALLIRLIEQVGVDLSATIETVRSAASQIASGAVSGMSSAYAEVQILFQIAQPAPTVAQTPIFTMTIMSTTADRHAEIYCALTIVWLLGASALTTRWLIRHRRFARSLRNARTVTAGREYDALRRAQSWLFVNREIRLVISSQVREPGVWGVQHPTVVFPRGVSDGLSDDEIATVMTHEVIHVWRRDNLIGALQMIVCNLLWFHPLVWLIDCRLSAEREMWCDETVIRLGGEPRIYAASLWKVAQFGLGWPVAGVSRAAGSNLKRRVEHMLKFNDQPKYTAARRLAAYGSISALALLSAAVGLFSGDDLAFAQQNKIEPTNKKELVGGLPGWGQGPVANGIQGGIVGGVKDADVAGSGRVGSGIEGGVAGGVSAGIGGAKTAQLATQDTQGDLARQRPNKWDKWESIKQAPEFPVKIENRSDAPLFITDARVRVMVDEESQGPIDLNSAKVVIAQFNVTLVNQTDRRIKGLVLKYENPGLAGAPFYATESKLAHSWATQTGPGSKYGNVQIGLALSELKDNDGIEPYGSYVAGKNSMHYHRRNVEGVPDFTTRFTIKVVDVTFETEPNSNQIVKAQTTLDPVQPMDSSTRPTILYREKAQYTQEAKDNNVEGRVVLKVVFGADSQIRDIEVVRELPYGLTESAIEAAKKIRFNPAMKDGQPVTVRGALEFTFKLN